MTRNGVTRALASGALALALGGCFWSGTERVGDDARSELLGLSERDLRRCLGVPTDFDRIDGVEFLSYLWVSKPRQPMGVTTPIGSGGIGGIVIGRRGAGGGYDPMGFPRDAAEQETCKITFELRNDAVTKVTAHGETETGLASDTKCILRARRCAKVRADDDDG